MPSAASPRHSGGRLIVRSVVRRQNRSGKPAAQRRPSGLTSASAPLSLLDQTGRLTRTPGVGEALAWRQELHAGSATSERAALLHLWLGETDLTVSEAPGDADGHFRQAMHLVPRSNRIWGAASFDRALVQFAVGDYDAAKTAFGSLIDRKAGAGLRGFSRANCALWMRHASACLGYHAQLGALGIPRPARLDPLCGAGGLAACLRAMHRPFDKPSILKACRVTGRGSNAADLLRACPKLGVVGRFVTADDRGLKLLPKPCIAYVEHDHFVTVLRADADGIAYLCTDCGRWPGGEVRLDWKQWHALEATGYITVTRSATVTERRLAALGVQLAAGSTAGGRSATRQAALGAVAAGVQVASASRTMAFAVPGSRAAAAAVHGGASLRLAGPALDTSSELARHVAVLAVSRQDLYDYALQDAWLDLVTCGFSPETMQCLLCVVCCAEDGIGMRDAAGRTPDRLYPLPTPGHQPLGHGSMPTAPPRPPGTGGGVPAPGSGDPVNLATLEEEYTPDADLTVYNPHGPSVHWHRLYDSLRGEDPQYEYDDFGHGWSYGYNYSVHSSVYTGLLSSGGGPHPAATHGGGGGGGVTPPPTDPQYVYYPNGSRVSFTIPVMPTATTPGVACTVQAGVPMLVSIYLDTAAGGSTPQYYFIVTFGDQTSFRFNFCDLSATYYPLCQIRDRVGNAIDLVYDAASGLMSGFPVLDSINDDSTGGTLLTINRDPASSAITSVADCYGRSVYYQESLHASGADGPFATGEYQLDQVSRIVASGTSSPPMRAQFGYSFASANPEAVNYLHTITTPSPTGTGTATATINYETEYGYFVTSLVDANGNEHDFVPVDANHTQVVVKNPLGAVVYSHTAGFNSDMSQTSDTDGQVDGSGANNHVMYTKAFADPYDPYRPSSVSDAAGRATSFTWDSNGHMKTLTDVVGTVTTATWDYSTFPLGRLTSSQRGMKPATTATYYEPSGLIESVTAPAPTGSVATTVTASATYDTLGNLLTITGPGNTAASTVTTTLGYTTDGEYTQSEGLGRPITVTDNLGHTSHTRYDTHWRAISGWDALGNEYDATYNIADQTLTSTVPATGMSGTGRSYTQATYQFIGGALANVKAFDESGTQLREVDYTYGPEGEGLSVSGSTENASFTYDAMYRVLTMSDGNSHTTTWAYGNAAGYLSSVTYPDTHTASYTSYDATGRLLQQVDQNGLTANLTYGNTAGDLTAVVYPGHTDQNVTFSYDGYGRNTNTTDAESSYSCIYGDRDEVVSGTRTYTGLPARTLSFTYNPDGSRASMQLPVAPSGYSNSNCYTYIYDAGQRLTGITDNLGNTSTFSYANNDWLIGQQAANGLSASYTRNALGQGTDLLNSFTSGGTTSTVSEFNDFGYDGVGNLTTATSTIAASSTLSGTTTFGYDSKDQLTSESSSATGAAYSNSFAYDSAGNATTFRGAARSFNSSNEFSGTGFVYDSAGNPTTYNGSTCTFDVFNRATSLGTYLTAGYRSDGMRAWKQDSSGNRTYFLYDGDSPLCEMDSSGNYKAEFLYGPAGLISHNRAGVGTLYFTYDERGSVKSAFSSTGTLESLLTYDSFGELVYSYYTSKSSVDPEIGYNGQSGYITDAETGLVLCGHRYYDPANGRWLNRDPIGYAGGINVYSYCTNNPVMGVDTSGLDAGWASGPGGAQSFWSGGGLPDSGSGWDFICNELVPDMALGLAIMDGGPKEGLEEEATMAAATEARAAAAEAKGGTYTLHGPQSGNVMRTGQTSNLAVRRAAHKRDYPDLEFRVDRRIDNYAARRGREHIIEERYQPILAGQRAIRLNHPLRDHYIRAGRAVP